MVFRIFFNALLVVYEYTELGHVLRFATEQVKIKNYEQVNIYESLSVVRKSLCYEVINLSAGKYHKFQPSFNSDQNHNILFNMYVLIVCGM